MPLSDCIATLPSGLRQDFRDEIVKIVTGMHSLGFALGVKDAHKAGYRTFSDQYNISGGATSAGPGESFHNYFCAVDLGFLEWMDDTGKKFKKDYWLGQMQGVARYAGFPALLWSKRDSFSDAVHTLSFEKIHLQSVPQATSGRSMLLKCLNQAALDASDANWQYRRQGTKYQCTLGATGVNAWKTVGTAKQMWDKTSTNSSAAQRETIRNHMEKAEVIAKTISLE